MDPHALTLKKTLHHNLGYISNKTLHNKRNNPLNNTLKNTPNNNLNGTLTRCLEILNPKTLFLTSVCIKLNLSFGGVLQEVPSRACAAAAVLLFRRGLRDWQLQPDIVTYSALLVLCARRGDANLATMLFSVCHSALAQPLD
jgi:hypothetical protein